MCSRTTWSLPADGGCCCRRMMAKLGGNVFLDDDDGARERHRPAGTTHTHTDTTRLSKSDPFREKRRSDAISARLLASSRAIRSDLLSRPPPTSAVPLASPSNPFRVSVPPLATPPRLAIHSINPPGRVRIRVCSIRSRSSSSVRSCTLLPKPSKLLRAKKQKNLIPYVCVSLSLHFCNIHPETSFPHPQTTPLGGCCSLGQKIRFRLVRPSSKDARIRRILG